MKRAILTAALTLAASLGISAGLTSPSQSAESDRAFFESVEGSWVGPGEIIAGKFKGTKFVCTFAGTTADKKLGVTLDGGCRVGMFTQKMTASVEHNGVSGYRGKFLDGASGSGLDIISGNVVDGRKVVLAINRNQLKGVMQARLPDSQTMTVSVSVKVDDSMIQVIGMNLKRVDDGSVGAIAGK